MSYLNCYFQKTKEQSKCAFFVCMQFLTELDGVETLTGVFVFAATRLAVQSMPTVIVSAVLVSSSFILYFYREMKMP